MFDPIGAFTRQFTPIEGGYLYYPSRKTGGKLVTAEEFEQLVSDWQRVAGTKATWKFVGLVALAILLWTFVSDALALPEWADWIIIIGCVAGLSGWLIWASMAPRRLLRYRPAITPPRPASEARREARATLNWPFVLFALLVSGVIFFGSVSFPDQSLSWWAWTIGSGLFFGLYVWTAVQKFQDRQR